MQRNITVRKPKEGTRIKKSGFYQIDNDFYHDDCCNAPSISSGGLVTMAANPKKFYHTSIYNKDAPEKKWAHHFNFGHAAHELILEGDLDLEKYAVRPETMKTWKSKDAQNWRKYRMAEGMITLSVADLDNLLGMAEAIKEHPVANEIFKSGMVETSMMVKHGGIFIKARPDIVPLINSLAINDFKTCTSISSARYDIKKYQYEAKLANVTWCMAQLIDDFPPLEELTFSLIFQETSAPWAIDIIPIDATLIRDRMSQNIAAAEAFEESMATGIWAHPNLSVDDPYTLRPYEHDKLKNRILSGEYPQVGEDWKIIRNNTKEDV